MRRMKTWIAIAFAVAILAATVVVRGASATAADSRGHSTDDLAAARAATARFHDLNVAKANGYALLVDAQNIACIDNPPIGAMGVHFVNGTLVGSGEVHPQTPQAMVYEPGQDGQLHLVAVEYIAFKAQWDATHDAPPMLFGQPFMLTTSPNRFGLPAFYSLHAWLWKNNPSGMFSMWNPQVSCTVAQDAGVPEGQPGSQGAGR